MEASSLTGRLQRERLQLGRLAARPRLHLAPTWHNKRDVRHVAALAGGGNGDSGKGGSSGGSGGGGSGGRGDGRGEGEGSEPNKPQKGGMFKGWEERVAYDPEFPIKVLMEQVIGVGACVIGDMSARPNWGLNELDFIFSTIIVGSIMNFTIMYLLAPTAVGAAASAASTPLLTRLIGDYYLRAWGAPGGNMFEPGAFTAVQRLTNFAYKGVVFAVIGFCAGVAGTALSNGLLTMRKQMDPSFKLQNEPPNIVWNAVTWGIHMGLSSNLRYQTLGGVDAALIKVMPVGAFRVYQALIRGANNVVGGMSFVTLARILGTQKASG